MSAIKLYHANGNRFVPSSEKNYARGTRRTIPANVEAELSTQESLYEMRFLSMPRRVELIRRQYNLSVST